MNSVPVVMISLGRNARRFSGARINRHPNRARFAEKSIVDLAADFGETFEFGTAGFADPCVQNDFIAETGRNFIVDLVP